MLRGNAEFTIPDHLFIFALLVSPEGESLERGERKRKRQYSTAGAAGSSGLLEELTLGNFSFEKQESIIVSLGAYLFEQLLKRQKRSRKKIFPVTISLFQSD